MKRIEIKLVDTDKDIIDHLDTIGNISDYIRKLIRRDMVGETKEKNTPSIVSHGQLDAIQEAIDETYKIVKRIERALPE
jgi:hypothetical protein